MSESLENSYFATIRKDKFSFSKSPRFPELKSNYTIDYFEKPHMKKRSTSFGYGSKFDFFQKKQYTPSPSQYHVDENEGRTNASSFGYGRNQIKHGSYIDPEKLKKDSRNYEVDPLLVTKHKGPSCVITGKHPQDSFVFLRNDIKQRPDPTKYDPNDSTFSRRKKSPVCKFGSSKRFDHRLQNFQRMVGPGTYDSKGKKEGSQNVVFTHARKKTFVVDEIQRNKNPGPQYNVK